MDRAVASGATGRRFESCQAYHSPVFAAPSIRSNGFLTAENTGGPVFCAAQESQGSGSDNVGATPKIPVVERGAESYGLAFSSSAAGLAAGALTVLGFQKSGSLLIHSSGT